ncbi:MAG TPA: hypothetical protein VGN88_08970 [Phycisphaerae bacterium]|jgi:hypothetical protein
MPLDVQPLSTRRQWVTLVVMVSLLGASLGMAQFLVAKKTIKTQVVVGFNGLQGGIAIPVNESLEKVLDGQLLQAQFKAGDKNRACIAFSFEDTSGETPSSYLSLLWFGAVTDLDPDKSPIEVTQAVIAGEGALQTEAQVGTKQSPAFAILRLAKIENHIVAFSYSGQGPLTDADRMFFYTYCLTQIRVSVSMPQGQPRHSS